MQNGREVAMEPAKHGSTAEQVRKAIREEIRNGVFEPGCRLTSDMLAPLP